MVGIVLLGLIGFSSPTMAQSYPFDNWSENAGMQWWNRDIPQEYALTKNQIARINKIRTKSMNKILPLQKKLVSLQAKQRRYNGYNNQQFLAYKIKIDELKNKIMTINRETRLVVQNILGQEQQAYFNNGGYGWWDSDDGCWYSTNTVAYRSYGRDVFPDYYDRCCW